MIPVETLKSPPNVPRSITVYSGIGVGVVTCALACLNSGRNAVKSPAISRVNFVFIPYSVFNVLFFCFKTRTLMQVCLEETLPQKSICCMSRYTAAACASLTNGFFEYYNTSVNRPYTEAVCQFQNKTPQTGIISRETT